MTNQEAIINFMYFGHNYPANFISKVWGIGSTSAKHLEGKFHSMYEQKGTLTFFSWFMELDNDNKDVLINYIHNNYRG
jgi:hypothetical protein